MARREVMRALVWAAGAGALALGGCASAKPPTNAPAWYVDSLKDDNHAYPDLNSIPRQTTANTDQAHWNQVEADVMAARAAMLSNPRSAPPTGAEASDAADFEAQARRDIDATRDTH